MILPKKNGPCRLLVHAIASYKVTYRAANSNLNSKLLKSVKFDELQTKLEPEKQKC